MNRCEAHLHIARFRKGSEDCISVRDLPNYQVHYAGTLVLTDVTFKVQPAGLRRYRETGQKNVHAYVRGTKVDETWDRRDLKTKGMREAYYNPLSTDTFVDKQTGEPVHTAKAAYLVGSKVYYI